MEKIKILILEDNTEEGQLLEQILTEEYKVVGVASNYIEAVGLYHLHKPDLVILDIFINDKREGIDLANYINENRMIPILFLTNAKDLETFKGIKNSNAFNYLPKPVDAFVIKINIELALEKFANQYGELSTKENGVVPINEDLFIKKKDSLFKISKDEIYYLEADDKYCHIHTKESKFLIQKSLISFSKEFPKTFFKTHRKFLVNKNLIHRIDIVDCAIILKNNAVVPISQRIKKEMKDGLNIFT